MSRYPQTMLATCCVPWNADGSVAETVFRASIQFLLSHGFRHLYIFGTAGEGYAVDEDQFDTVVRIFVDELRGRGVPPMVGLISLSLPTIVKRVERCRDLGVEDFQLSLPSWGALSERELFTFFAETCGRFPELRFLHYNLPRAQRLVTPEEYAVLAARYPNLVATKNARADLATIAALLDRAGELRHFFTEPGYSYGSLFGACGFLVSLASISPYWAHAYFQAGVRRDSETLRTLCRELLAMGAELERAVGGEAHMDGAYDKIFCKIHDRRFPLRLLPPYEGATDDAFHRFLRVLHDHYPRWVEATAPKGDQ